MKTSEKAVEIFTALAKAQGAFPEIKKDKKVDVKSKDGKFLYSYMFAQFPTIVDAVRAALSVNGLSFFQGVSEDGKFCLTRLSHSSGEWIETTYPLFYREDDMQGFGGGFTFAKRYALSGILGIAADEDDDGNAALDKEATFKPIAKPVIPKTTNSGKSDPGEYTVTMGQKYLGQKLKDIDPYALADMVDWLKDKNRPDYRPAKGAAVEFLNNADAFLKTITQKPKKSLSKNGVVSTNNNPEENEEGLIL